VWAGIVEIFLWAPQVAPRFQSNADKACAEAGFSAQGKKMLGMMARSGMPPGRA